jgi:ABC-type uncharacterized transport system substrate-binding protein
MSSSIFSLRPARWLCSLLALALLFAVAPAPVQAHPHAWIDVRIKVLFDTKGRVYGLEETWIFDPLYTAFALDDGKRKKGQPPSQKDIDALAAENLKNIKDYDYLTLVESNGRKVSYAGTRDLSSAFEKDRLRMTFTLLLATPLNPTVSPVDYRVFDPTYYIEMLHAEDKAAIQLKGAGSDCKHTLTPANPSPDAVGLAASLDKNQTAGDGLGKLFAERVTIRCGVQP